MYDRRTTADPRRFPSTLAKVGSFSGIPRKGHVMCVPPALGFRFGLRFGFTSGGCSGNKYIIEFEDAPEADDMIFTFGEVRVFVKTEQMAKLKNSVIDWKESLMESGFDIDNPQAKRACGCGESVDLR